ncbi:MAG: hypothetical protein WC959_01675 [Kiritimatiellales bacterium]
MNFSCCTVTAMLMISSAASRADDIFAGLDDFEFDPGTASVVPVITPPPENPPAEESEPETALEIRPPVLSVTPPPVFVAPEHPPEVTDTPPEEIIIIDVPEYQPLEEMPAPAVQFDEAKAAYCSDDFDRAQNLFESVAGIPAYQNDAAYWLKRVAEKKDSGAEKLYDATRKRMLADVQSAWSSPAPAGKVPADLLEEHELSAEEQKIAALRTKLETIFIPAIAFHDADIQQVVLELSALCRKLDPEHKGVNFVVFGISDTVLPLITFSGTALSALETLEIVTQIAGMKYEIGTSMVSITPVNYESPAQMVAAEFDIIQSVVRHMLASGAPESSNGMIDVRQFFGTVPFPPGTSAQYSPEFGMLLVRNSPKHIEKIDTLLRRYTRRALEESARQVEIETKFIEVAQGALDELGFEWTVGAAGDWINQDRWSMPGGQKLFSDTLRTGETAFSIPVGISGDTIRTGLTGPAGELLIQKVQGTPANLIIRALERTSGSDLLSAPKILTKSGETASIHVGEVHWYPTAFDVGIERYAQTSLIPLDYEEQRTGVILEVTPELDSENGTINMKLAPEIRELAGFNQEHVATLWPFFTGGNNNAFSIESMLNGQELKEVLGTSQRQADRLFARRPVFKTRKVNTAVTIQDGTTIAMGGLIKEHLETFKDSVPVLGKIPLIGRLFRSEGERSIKRNLLIFVTANQVDAAGNRRNL